MIQLKDLEACSDCGSVYYIPFKQKHIDSHTKPADKA